MIEHRHHRPEDHRPEDPRTEDPLAELVQELLDAHADTLCLVDSTSLRWAAHVEYLRDLQRIGKERLAALCGAAGSRGGTGG